MRVTNSSVLGKLLLSLLAGIGVAALFLALFLSLQPSRAQAQTSTTISFGKSDLKGATLSSPTSLQFGPDGRLYVAQQDGTINIYTVARNGTNDYSATATETITLIKEMPNHNDNGTLNTSLNKRQVTGILVAGTAANPVLYVSSSDPRIGGGGTSVNDTNLDTNSGIISRLTWNGTSWNKVDLVRGLPRSEENHSVNGMQLSPDGSTLYVAVGGNTNKGAPSSKFALLPEYALAAAILSIDLTAIGNTTYDLKTLDDENRSGSPDTNDPFGGNNGKNQAIIDPNGPVQVHASGFRNAYDLVVTESGRMYTVDNGGNESWGDIPENEGPTGVCTNKVMDTGTTDKDSLHYVSGKGYYGGHPNPTRGNKNNTFNGTNPQSPVPTANPIECDYRANGAEKGELTTFGPSTNGIAEYTASNFGGAMQGDLLAAGFVGGTVNGIIFRMKPNTAGDGLVTLPNGSKQQALFTNFGSLSLDVTAQGDSDRFPGTVWAVSYGTGGVHVFEPGDYNGGAPPPCSGADDPSLDEDGDGYTNADEIDNGTDPCSAASVPSDWDGDGISNKNDPDDDNDGSADEVDPFAIDPENGKSTSLPVSYTWDNDAPKPGGLLSLGFTGLMSNGTDNYEGLFDPNNMTAGGAAGVLTIDNVPAGDAKGSTNTQHYGLQFGVNATSNTGVFTAHTRILEPFVGMTPQGDQSMGLFIGKGDQDNYVKLVTSANGILFAQEAGGSYTAGPTANVNMPGPSAVDLFLTVDPAAGTVQPSYAVTTDGQTGPRTNLGSPKPIPSGWLGGTTGLAAGIISTSAGGSQFPASWDLIEVVKGTGSTTPPPSASELVAEPADAKFGSVLVGQEKTTSIKLTNSGVQDDITIESTEISPATSGTTAAGFSDSFASQVTLKPGESTTLAVTFKPGSAGSQAGTLSIGHTGANSPLNIPLTGHGAPGAPYRVNAGGVNQLTGPPGSVWSTDSAANPSPYVNAIETGNKLSYVSSTTQIDLSHPSIPPGTPQALFRSERWDPSADPEMVWKFPVEPGDYKVRLYFAETFSVAQKPGGRVFDVVLQSLVLEGQTVLKDYDIYTAAGGGNKGIVETFDVTSDGTMNILFKHGPANHPAIKAIEILPSSNQSGAQLNASPSSVDFGSVEVDTNSKKTVTLTNPSSSSGNLSITGTSLAGSNAFSASLPGPTPITLQPGESTQLSVTFAPTSEGPQSAELSVAHDGTNNPLKISLAGTGSPATSSSGSDALVQINPGTKIDSTTHSPGSLKIKNNSLNGEKITSLRLDISTAILPDLVFDPNGEAGDTTFKCLTADSGASLVGYVQPSDPCVDPFSSPHEGGYQVVELQFNNFDPGETFTFSADVDPTSIKGSTIKGSQGSVSGLELTGTAATVGFGAAGTYQAETYRIPASDGGSQNTVKQGVIAKPTIAVPGVTLQPTTLSDEHFAATVNQASQTVRISGPAGADVSLLVLEGWMQTGNLSGGGYDVEPYEANRVVKVVSETTAQIGTDGTVDVPVTLARTYLAAGLNYMVAVVKDENGRTGANSNVVILKW